MILNTIIDDIDNKNRAGIKLSDSGLQMTNCFYMFRIKTALLQLFHEP